jgi:hypothetical protein
MYDAALELNLLRCCVYHLILATSILELAPHASAQLLLGDQPIEPSRDSNMVGQAEALYCAGE